MTSFVRLCFALLVLGTFGVALVPAAHADGGAHFVSVIEDLPLMPGLSEDVDAAMTFESADGRIAEAFAYFNPGSAPGDTVSVEAVRAFYAASLPQLGWRPLSDGVYQRADEGLELVVSAESGGGVSVQFALRPKKP